MASLEVDENELRASLLRVLNEGRKLEKEKIINALNNDAVISTCMSTDWLEYIVRIIDEV